MAKNWSGKVTKKSDALDLEENVFTWNNPKEIASSLKKSAETSGRRKGTPYQSAMSMLNFYINRAEKIYQKKDLKFLKKPKLSLKIFLEENKNRGDQSMPAKTEKQRKAAGAALAAKRGSRSKKELKGASKDMVSMSKKELEEMASKK